MEWVDWHAEISNIMLSYWYIINRTVFFHDKIYNYKSLEILASTYVSTTIYVDICDHIFIFAIIF